MKKRIAILGSTGSVGVQALEVIAQCPQDFEVEMLAARRNVDLLIAQARRHLPNAVVITDPAFYLTLKDALKPLPVKVFAGNRALEEALALPSVDIVLNAIVGIAGLLPTLAAIDAGKTIALANKETLVAAGELIRRRAIQKNVSIIPVDSEHSAIFQCLAGEPSPPEKVILTASGGPFLNTPLEKLPQVTKNEALRHPQWQMGSKITIDSATMMNKGFEVIEARWLFDLPPERIEVVVHPQSIVHSLVQFADGALKAQMGVPDMRLPIAYALSHPHRLPLALPRCNLAEAGALTFLPPDMHKFPCLQFAYDALGAGGVACCALNAANEAAVAAFLADRIPFVQIARIVEQCLARHTPAASPALEDYLAADTQARQMAEEWAAH